MTNTPSTRTVLTLTTALVLGTASTALAQLDPLISLKALPPNVIVVVDTSFRMLNDGNGNYYDPKTYNRADDLNVANMLGVTANTYRRVYHTLLYDSTQDSTHKYTATGFTPVQDTASGFSSFWSPSRLEMAKSGINQAVGENAALVRWGMMRLRQRNPVWQTGTNCSKPVRISASPWSTVSDTNPCSAGGVGLGGKFGVYAPAVDNNSPNYATSQSQGNPYLYNVSTTTTNASNIQTLVQRPILDNAGLIPAGLETSLYEDRPIDLALQDARAKAVTAIGLDSNTKVCRNNVVVLITGGKDDGDTTYVDTHDPVTTAGTFASVSSSGVSRRVPIIVIGVNPSAADEAELTAIATASGGRYFRATSAGDVAFALNYAVQLGFSKSTDFDLVRASEYTGVSPIIGTVNLAGAASATGAVLPNTNIVSTSGQTAGQTVPQRSNFLLTGGYSLPSFDARLRAFRVYKPEPDSTKPTGWRFVADGTRLWPDVDGRPSLAGLARTPASASSRNIYTYVPDGVGGGQVVAFDVSQSAALAPHLGGADPAVLIPFVRSLPLGGIIGSTPAIMDPPSLDPPPDTDYGFPASVGTFAGTHKDRRSMIFFGANDGMVHAVDARTGFEVWAFIPYNLLPKLRTLLDGQSVEQFDYFVDSSPKIAEVKLGGAWKTMLIIGQSYGGTFYQAFDVTEAGMGVAPTDDGIGAVNSMLSRFDAPGETIQFSWAFPNYSSFDPDINFTATLTDGFPGGKVRLYGDLKATATNVEKRVGFTFSDPAVGTLTINRSVNAVITGSGYFPAIEGSLANRASVPAGHALFLLNAETGLPIGNASGGSCGGTGCFDVGDVSNGRKNTLQADVTASGDAGSNVVVKAYVGDSDGKYWRFAFTSAGAITSTQLFDTGQPIYSSSALLFVGTSNRYLFFGTGSDLLAASTPGGGSTGQGTTFKLYGIKDSSSPGVAGTVTFTRDLSPRVKSADLLTNGERPTSAPTVAGDIVFFTTTTDGSTAECAEATSKLYAFTYLGTAAYDSNGSGSVTNGESPLIGTTTGRGTAPFIVDQHLYFATTSLTGTGVTLYGDPADFNNGVGQVGVRILSWREIR